MRRFTALLAAAVLAGCGGAGSSVAPFPAVPPGPEPLELGSALADPPDAATLDRAATQLRRHLADPSWEVREEATRRLEGLGPPAVRLLARLFPDADPEIAWRVRRVLEHLGWPDRLLVDLAAREGAEAASLVAAALREEMIERAGPAIRALGRIGGPRAREAAEALCADPKPRTRYHAARALGEIGDPGALPVLERLKQDADAGVRFAAWGALSRLGRPEAFEAGAAALIAQAGMGRGIHLYNLACLSALSGREAEALEALQEAFEAGFRDGRSAAADPDLYDLRGSPAWQILIARMGASPP